MASKEKIEALKNNPKALKGMTQSEALIMRQLLDVEDMADELKGSLKDIDLRDVEYVKGEKGEKGDKGDTGEQGIKGEKGDKGDTGDSGHTPTRAEIEAIIIPLIEKPEKIDTTALVNEVLAQIPAADLDAIADIVSERVPSLSQPIRDSLELLQGNERLMTSAIHDKKRDKGLDAVLDDFEQDITKKTQTIIAGGGARQAYQVNVDTTNFNSNLSSADDTVQKALETLDDAVTGSSAFTGLTDTPSSYTGQAGKFAKVKATEDGLEFGSGDGIGDMLKATYDTDGDGIVDNAEALQGHPASDFAPALGTDDNYVTDAEKAALHSHSNKAVLDATTASFTTADETKLDGIAAGAEVNVNADWNASSGDAQILNKPTLATVATTGAYSDLSGKPTLGTAAALNTGTTNGTIPVLGADDKLNSALIPDLAITEFLGNFTNLTAALADAGVNVSQKGDWFTTDEDKSYIVTTNNPTLSTHVTQLKTPTGGVSSVFSRTGAITAQSGDYTTAQVTEVTNLYFTDARALAAAPAETTTTVGSLISGATGKTTPVDADAIGLSDSAASNVLKSLTWANVKATLKTYFDTLYQASGSYLSNIVEDTTPQLGGTLDTQGNTILGGTSTTADLTLQTTSGIGATGADMHFKVGNNGATEAMTILNSGNVGIGTTTPETSFVVNKTSGTGYLANIRSAVDGIQGGFALHQLNTSYTNPFSVNSGDGFTTGDPVHADFVGGILPWSASGGVALIGNSNATGVPGLAFEANQGVEGTTRAALWLNAVTSNGLGNKQSLASGVNVFQVANNGSQLLTVQGSGNVGIGTTSPAFKLDVNGTARFGNSTNGVDFGSAAMRFAGSAPLIYTSGYGAPLKINASAIYLNDASGGNVGIGTTTPTAYLHIKAGTASASTAPIKLTAGTLNTTPEAGAIEFDGTDFYFTI